MDLIEPVMVSRIGLPLYSSIFYASYGIWTKLMGDYFEGFINEEAKQLGQTIPEITAWTPPAKTRRKKSK